MKSGALSRAAMGRLHLYLRFMRTVTTDTISSAAVARSLGLGEVQVRKDLAGVCPAGMPKVGYPSARLRGDLETALGMERTTAAIVVGAGKLGRALMAYDGFREYGLKIAAAFDANESEDESMPVLGMDAMPAWCAEHGVRLGVLAVPDDAAQEAAERMAASGITAILTFASAPIRVPGHVTVHREDIALSLACLKMAASVSNQASEEDAHGKQAL